MRKLRLELDVLVVESFSSQEEDGDARGTVDAHAVIASNLYSCVNSTCRCPSHHNTECCGAL